MNKKVEYRPVLIKTTKGYYPRIIKILKSGGKEQLPKGYKYSPRSSCFIVIEPIKKEGK